MNLGGHNLKTFKKAVASGWQPRRPQCPHTWLAEHVRYPEGWETTRFDYQDCPHVRGVVDAAMDDSIRKIILVWATRLAKTTTVEGLLAWKADQDPVPMAALFPDNEQLDQVDDHLYEFFEAVEPIRKQLPPPHVRNKKVIRLDNCRIRLASGGKKSSVSGYPARWVVKFEHDKLGLRKSSEADPSLRIDSRTSGFRHGVKIFEEGTPAKRSASRAAKALESPDNMKARGFVKCPHCGKYQQLTHDQLEWEKTDSGRSDPQLAEQTAWYACSHNGCRIESHERREMMQSFRWVIDGQQIDDDGSITGTPEVQSDTIVFGPLSKLYSLLISGWGVIASALVKARHQFALGNEGPIEKLYSEDLAIPWDPMRRKVRTNDLSNRMRAADHQQRGVIPKWASFLTFTSDVGMIQNEMVFYSMVIAWGQLARGAIVDWQIYSGRDLFLSEWKSLTYHCEDGTEIPVWGQPAGIDAGNWQTEIADLCKPIKNCFPTKGDTRRSSGAGELYYPGFQKTGLSPREIELKKKAGAYDLLWIATHATQSWRVALTEGRLKPDSPGFVSIPADVLDNWEEHEGFLDELTADTFVEGKWIGENNEFGDCLRYGRALAECVTQAGKRWGRLQPIAERAKGQQRLFSRVSKPDDNGGHFVKGMR